MILATENIKCDSVNAFSK